MRFATPFCGSAAPIENPLQIDSCVRETLFDALLPLAFLVISLLVSVTRACTATLVVRTSDTADGLRLPTAKQAVLLRRSLWMLVLVLLDISCWAFLFAWRLESVILERDNPDPTVPYITPLYKVIDPGVALLPRVYVLALVIKSFTTPSDPAAPSRFTIYNPHFLALYSFTLMGALMRLWATFMNPSLPAIERPFAMADFAIGFTLWVISATTPTEYDPRELLDFDDAEDSAFVLHDGRIVRNGRILSLEANASSWSTLTFSWMNPLLCQANKLPLMPDQLWALPVSLRAQENYVRFMHTQGTLVTRLYRANRKSIIIQLVASIVAVVFHYAHPFFLYLLLNYIQDPKGQPKELGYLYCVAIFTCSTLGTIAASQTLSWGRRWHVHIINMLSSVIYCHALQQEIVNDPPLEVDATLDGEQDTTVNQRAGLLSQDTERLAELASCLHVFYTCPLEVAAGTIFLYHLLGTAFLAGLLVMVVALPATHYVNQRLFRAQKHLAEAKSWRLQLLKELFESINTIKVLAWERKWMQVITAARDDELVRLIKLFTQSAIRGLIWFAAPVFVTSIAFAWYMLIEHKTLDASTAFVSILLFGMLREPLNVIPQALVSYNDARASLDAVSTFLSTPKKQGPENNSDHIDLTCKEQLTTGFDAGTFQWHSGTPFTMFVPALKFPCGSLSVITGPKQSGKTSILRALLGEVVMTTGHAYLPSRHLTEETSTKRDPNHSALFLYRVAYVPQVPWIESGTVRENILFSEPWEDSRYRTVLYQCDLLRDLSLLENGDLTQIGERGVTISMSLKQKISLARAAYSRAKTVIIDQFASDLDPVQADHLIQHCVCGDLMIGRTIIMVTMQLKPCAGHIKLLLRLDDGCITFIKTDNEVTRWIAAGCDSQEQHSAIDTGPALSGHDDRVETLFEARNVSGEEEFFDEASVMRESIRCAEDDSRDEQKSRDIAYATYFSACGGWRFWSSAIIFTILARLASISEIYWLKEEKVVLILVHLQVWTTGWIPVHFSKDPHSRHYILTYLVLCLVTVAFNFVRTVVHYRGSLRASNRLFQVLLQTTCRAPLSFFDATPLEEIMNRFNKDIETVDANLGWHVNFLLQTLVGVVGTTVVIGIILPEFFIASFLAAVLYFYVGAIYIRASRELKKLNSDSRPLVSGLYNDTLTGLATIRAYGEQPWMIRRMFQRLDDHMRSFYTLWAINRWLFVRVEFLGASLSLVIGLLLIFNLEKIDAGLAGIALTFAANLLEYIYWLMRQSTTVDMHFEAVERINHYMDMPQEPPGTVEGSRPPAAWPTEAAIHVRDLMVSFGTETEAVLNHLTFHIKPGERVALVGRAEGEVQVLIASLFRFVEPLRGSIKIDGVNIAWIGIEDLRSRITYISKDGNMLSGTVRSNLDPFGEYDDYELWQVLYRVHLARAGAHESITLPGDALSSSAQIHDLDMDLGKGGTRLSVGDRQLLCIARALLRDCTKLVVLEENKGTNDRMTRVIQDELKDSTLLVVPYRLETARHASFHRVMVFDQGELIEFAPATELLSQPGSLLRSLLESGQIENEDRIV